MSLASTVAQILDKLSDLVVGPVRGTILASATQGIVTVPQGLLAALPDGRLVRVVQGKRVGTSPSPISVRLLFLAPSAPTAGNFAPVADGLTATWRASVNGASGPALIPEFLSPTGITTMFGYTSRAATVRVGSCVEACELNADEDLFKCGALGGASIVILDPETGPLSGSTFNQAGNEWIEFRQATWKVRVNVSTMAPAKGRRVAARDLQDNLLEVLQGASAGDDQITIEKWKFVRRGAGVDTWELTIGTKDYSEGRSLQVEAQAGAGAFTKFVAGIVLPGDADQPAPFRVRTTVGTSRGFDSGFDSGFGAASGASNVGFDAGFDRGFG